MPKIKYVDIKFKPASVAIIVQANIIVAEYQAQGFDLTLRQLYYQFVARGFIPNRDTEYKKLGGIINDARLAGLIDWLAIVDRTRNLKSLSHWDSPARIIEACADQYNVDHWKGQTYRPEVWIEKDALVGVIEGVCQEFDVPYFSCRGYTSQSEVWVAAQRLAKYKKAGQTPLILHFGDHDPSGLDMTRDITDRLHLFMGGAKLRRLALNMDQVQQYNPPPNPAKSTDSRFAGYIAEHGGESWELDALDPTVLAGLIRAELQGLIDDDVWKEQEDEQVLARKNLSTVSDSWDTIERMIADEEI